MPHGALKGTAGLFLCKTAERFFGHQNRSDRRNILLKKCIKDY